MMAWWLGEDLGADGTLVWGADPWLVLLATMLAVLSLVLVHRRAGDRKGVELACWWIAASILVWGISDPQWVEDAGRTEPGRSVVLVDESRSMSVTENGQVRGDRVSSILSMLGSNYDVFSFSDDLRAGPPQGWVGSATNIGAALSAVTDRYLGQSLRSVVVITDGIDRGGLRDTLRASPQATVPDLPGPLTVYQIGEQAQLIDVAVKSVNTGGFAFLRTPFFLSADLSGTPGRSLDVTLRREGRLVETIQVSLDASGAGQVTFEVTPNEVGRFIWEVSVPVEANDGVPGNNRLPVVVRVVRDRTRVLQVCGSPSYDQKFLRLFLKEDPSVDLVSFFILRTHEDFSAGWYPEELSLIAFPYEHLFSEQLESFDVVILQNFDYKPYFERAPNILLENLARFVREGGALVMVGGDRSFDLGEYAGTPIEEVLPVKLGVPTNKVDLREFRPQLTDAGLQHPVTRLAGTAADNAAAWERLPMLDGMNRTMGLAPDAAMLLGHSDLRVGDEPMPVLAIREVGKGRTMALSVDASWRWSFSEAATGRGNQAYLRFWKGALRWLVADPDERCMVVRPSSENLLLGEEVRLTSLVRDAGYSPVIGAHVRGWIEAPDGKRTEFEAETAEAGEASTIFQPTAQGAHRVRVSTSDGGEAETVFSVTTRDPELSDIMPDAGFLLRLVSRYGEEAVYREAGDNAPPLVDKDAVRIINEQRQTSLASVPLSALFFGFFASLAWWVRRRNGGR
jgi:uncharacterized membrane protein